MSRGLLGICVLGILASAALLGTNAACTSSNSGGSNGGGSSGGSSSRPTDCDASLRDAGALDSCCYVTQSQASTAIGYTLNAGELGNATVEGGLACVFYGNSLPQSLRDPNVALGDSVRVVVVDGPDALMWFNDYQSKVQAQPVSGYGDKAFYDGYASLSVLKGNYYLRIAISPYGMPPSLQDEEMLAAVILPNL
jgi:hypothetical protein